MVTIKELSANIKIILQSADIENYVFESRCILEHFLKIDHRQLIICSNKTVDQESVLLCENAALKRSKGYPLQYILGKWEFFGFPFYVGEGVLIPRQDTETLVENTLKLVKNNSHPYIIDLCSGSGCIAISLDKSLKYCDVSAIEYSDIALDYLKKNIKLNNSSVKVFKGDVLDSNFVSNFKNCDIITANPPYLTQNDMEHLQKEVEYEPSIALYGGDDGLLFYKKITKLWKNVLKPNGIILFEIGIGQEQDVKNILSNCGFINIEFYSDLCGVIRVVSGVHQ